jgi:hypothetical protein
MCVTFNAKEIFLGAEGSRRAACLVLSYCFILSGWQSDKMRHLEELTRRRWQYILVYFNFVSSFKSNCGRVVKALDSKFNGIFPHRFESCQLRTYFCILLIIFNFLIISMSRSKRRLIKFNLLCDVAIWSTSKNIVHSSPSLNSKQKI